MKHGKPLIGYRNNLKGATFRAGSQVQAAPASNLATDIGAEPWQTAGVRTADNGAWVEIDAGEEVPWRAFLLARTNLTSEATARFMVGAPTNVMVLDGTAGTYASTPHSAAVDITGDLAVVFRLAADEWDAGVSQFIAAKANMEAARSWALRVDPNGDLRLLVMSSDETYSPGYPISHALPEGETVWLAVTWTSDNGDGNSEASYYSSSDGQSWTLIGTTRRAVITGGLFSNSDALSLGALGSGSSTFPGKIHYAALYSGSGFNLSSGPTGTLVAEFNAEDATLGSGGGDTFVSSSTGETWTLHGTAAIEREFLSTYDSGLLTGLVPGYQQLVHVADADIIARHLRIEVDDPDNPDGFIRIGMAFAGPIFQPERGIEHGANFGVAGLRQDITTRGGQTYPVALYQQRQWQVSFPALTEEEMYAEGLEIQRAAEMGGNVLFVPRPGNGLEQQETVFGMLQSRATFGFPHYGLRSWAFTVTERL